MGAREGGAPYPECGQKAAAHVPCPRLLHFPGASPSLSGRSSPGSGSSLGKREPWPTNLQCKVRQLFPPQLLLSVSAKRDLGSPVGWFVLLEKRFDVAEPPANGATGTREGLFSVGSGTWSGAAPGAVWGTGARGSAAGRAHAPRLRHDWLARVAPHQLSCQPRAEAGLPAASVRGPSQPRWHASPAGRGGRKGRGLGVGGAVPSPSAPPPSH